MKSPSRREFLGTGAALAAARNRLPAAGLPALDSGFQTPPDSSKIWVYWWWVNGNVTEKSIVRDLEEMKKKGVGGFLMFDSRAYGERNLPPPPAPFDYMSAGWRRMLRLSMREAARLGLEMSANLSTHGGTLRSPWKTGADAPKKLVWTAVDVRGPGRVAVEVSRPPGAHSWDVAALAVRGAGLSKGPAGEWRDIAVSTQGPVVESRLVIDLTARVGQSGRLEWDAPEGEWTILRFACVTMDGYELDVDILNAEAAERHFDALGRKFLEDAGPLAGKTLTHFYNVSWEGASPTWTPGFEGQFERFRGYSLFPYLPALAGITVHSPEVTARFLEDFGRTLSDCFLINCYAKLGDLCHRAGMKWHSESGGPWDRTKPLFAYADQLAFWGRNDAPQGEFWHPRATLTNCRRTAMAAHIYGRPLAYAEAFTNMVEHWSEYPALVKPRGDAAFIDGINHFIWHTFDASPEEFGKPGIVYFAGSHLNPNVTWWPRAGDWIKYLGRCQHLLRQGRFVSDVCVYTSDRNHARWGRDESWSETASLSLGNGYTYDIVNTEVLVERLSVRGGVLELPDGMSYRLLVVDLSEDAVPPEAMRKVLALAEAGATVVLGSRRPVRAPGLKDAAARDAEVLRLAGELWEGAGAGPSPRTVGKGKVYRGVSLDEVLRAEGIPPDCAGPCEYNHRRAGEADIYFVTGQGKAECTFRVNGKEPELWDPVSGSIRDAVHYRVTDDRRVAVPLGLPENGSLFVVFRRPAPGRHVVSISGPENGLEIGGRTPRGVQVRLWRRGSYVLRGSTGAAATLDARVPEPLALAGPWEVRFAPGWGAPESRVFDRLIPWNEHPEEDIRYFSGAAVYRKAFLLDARQAKGLVRLDLGQVKCLAHVTLNGKPLGVLWTAPWTIDLTGAVQSGSNVLEVEVTNTWTNRLIGDARLPESQWRARTIVRRDPEYKGRNPHLRGYLATDPLQPSGLMGPVELWFGESREARL